MASSTGYVTGFILCAFLLAKLSRFFLLLIATLRFDNALQMVIALTMYQKIFGSLDSSDFWSIINKSRQK